MRDKETPKLFSVCIDEEAHLCEDGEPDILGAEDEVVVAAVGMVSGPDEAVGGGRGVILAKEAGREGGLDYALAAAVLAGTGHLEEFLSRVDSGGLPASCWVVVEVDCDGHADSVVVLPWKVEFR